ncbi:MAG TPA: DnaJ C-terminal domain-containing protein [Nitrospirales bacterium]|nr:DnaJ C-terminal domain-containing protein [Nitrospirales bacterium]
MATTERDYYDILGVSRTATPDDIKKAYRRLARQYHPDLHSGGKKSQMEEKFKELNMAHEVLSNPETRKKYDQYGHRWKDAEAYERARREAGASGGGFRDAGGGFRWESAGSGGAQFEDAEDMGDLFARFFRGAGGDRGGASARGFAMPGADLETTVRLTIREVLTGVSRRVTLSEPTSQTLEVKIPAGVHDGMRVRVAGKGAPGSNGGRPGDLYLRVEVVSDKVFRRHGDDVHVTLPVWPWEAALGAEALAPTLTEPVKVKIPPGSSSGAKLRLKGKGLPTESGGHGDLFFVIQIIGPSKLTDEERALYQKLRELRATDPRSDLLREAGHG